MSYIIKEINNHYNEEILVLNNSLNTGSEKFIIKREPQFTNLYTQLGEGKLWGIFQNELLIGIFSITKQSKFINQSASDVYYLHDLKITPTVQRSILFGLIIKFIKEEYKQTTDWLYSLVLNENKSFKSLSNGRSVYDAQIIANITHWGFAMYRGQKKQHSQISQIDSKDAWEIYIQHHQKVDFSLADKAIFLSENGFYLGAFKNNKLVAICKIIDQSNCRQIIATKSNSLTEKLINFYCTIKNIKGLPRKNTIFNHAYLAYYSSHDTQYRSDFIAYMRTEYANKYAYIFTGFSQNETLPSKSFFDISFKSSLIAYGKTPKELNINNIELTLI